MKKVLLIIILLMFAAGCSDDDEDIEPGDEQSSGTTEQCQYVTPENTVFTANGRELLTTTGTGACKYTFALHSYPSDQYIGAFGGPNTLYVYNLDPGEYIIKPETLNLNHTGECTWEIEVCVLGAGGSTDTDSPDTDIPDTETPGTDIPEDCTSDIYNCGDFSSCSDAYNIFNKCYPYSGDIHMLDGNNDGIPCDTRCK